MPANWLERVNQTDDAQELEALRRSVQRGRPFGQPEWHKEIAKRLGLESAYRPTDRPRKRTAAGPPSLTISDLFNNIGPVPLSCALPLSCTNARVATVAMAATRFWPV